MKLQRTMILFVALAGLALPSSAQAVITHYNVDVQTLPGGQVAITPNGTPSYSLGVITYPLIATNSGGALTDVRFLLQFVKPNSGSALTFTDGTDTWSNGTDTLSWISSGILQQGGSAFSMNNTNAPLSFGVYGTLASGVTVPQVLIGNMGAGGTFPFTIQANLSSNFPLEVVGSAVAVPEPSTLALLGFASLALLVTARKRFAK